MNVSPVDRVIAVRMVRIATVSMSRPDVRRFVAQRHRIAPYDQVRAVITAAVTNTAGYTVWAFKPKGSTVVYDYKQDQFAGASLDSVASNYAAGGYVITAAVTNTAGYTVWGFKPKGSTVVYDYEQDQFAGASLDSIAASYAASGHLITAAVTNTAGYTVWGFKAKP